MLKLSPPWNTYQKKVKALFERDPAIAVGDVYEVDDDVVTYAFDVLVSDPEKFKALYLTLPKVVEFGNVKLAIILHNVDDPDGKERAELYKAIFKDNPIVKDIREVKDPAGAQYCFIRFEPEVIQFFNDDTSDFNRNWSGLAQDIAREVFDSDFCGVLFCTADKRENEGS